MVRFFSGILLVVLVSVSSVRAEYPSEVLTQAIALQESRNNDRAVGDKHLSNHAYGAFQVRQPCIDDVNAKFGTHHKAEDCLDNRELSEWVFREYINIYATKKHLGHAPTEEDCARIWNGGPNGFKRSTTIQYWHSVQKLIETLGS
jgi:hypothetical protein